jgi:hypothetical protein
MTGYIIQWLYTTTIAAYIIQWLLKRLIISKWLARKHNIQYGKDKPILHHFSPFFKKRSCYSIFSFLCSIYVDRYLSFCPLSFGFCIVCPSSNTDSDYPFDILRLFLAIKLIKKYLKYKMAVLLCGKLIRSQLAISCISKTFQQFD